MTDSLRDRADEPHCDDCGRVIVVGSAIGDRWCCNYCQTVKDFDA